MGKRGYIILVLIVSVLLAGGFVLLFMFDSLRVTNGEVVPEGNGRYLVSTPTMRAYFKDSSGDSARLSFIYRGKTEDTVPLESGAMRQQIGLKLRAEDSCNTLYVMWRIEPAEGIVVSSKRNPDQHTHEECGASGYTDIEPSEHSSDVRPVQEAEERVLSAELEDTLLSVYVDDSLVWQGDINRERIAPEGPSGMRTDNGIFEITPNWE